MKRTCPADSKISAPGLRKRRQRRRLRRRQLQPQRRDLDVHAHLLFHRKALPPKPAQSNIIMQTQMLIAAQINRINEERLAAGKSVLGFLNPAMYANPGMFNDITNGSNPNCK